MTLRFLYADYFNDDVVDIREKQIQQKYAAIKNCVVI